MASAWFGVPHISGDQIGSFKFSRPPQSEQIKIAGNADEIHHAVERLESIYQRKLTAMAELKQSLLQKAFAGELTAGKKTPIATLKEEEVA